LVDFTFLDETLIDDRIQIWIEPPVVDLAFLVVLELVFNCESVWFVLPGNRVQQVTLEAC
jgi:hypothetical protein